MQSLSMLLYGIAYQSCWWIADNGHAGEAWGRLDQRHAGTHLAHIQGLSHCTAAWAHIEDAPADEGCPGLHSRLPQHQGQSCHSYPPRHDRAVHQHVFAKML